MRRRWAAAVEADGRICEPPSFCPNAERFHLTHARLGTRSEEHTSELQSLMRISYAVFCLKKKTTKHTTSSIPHQYQVTSNTPQNDIKNQPTKATNHNTKHNILTTPNTQKST